MAKASFKLKKNLGKQIVPILGHTGSTAAGFVGGRYLNKMITSPKVTPMAKGLGMMVTGIAIQLIDNEYAEDAGKGMFIAGLQTSAEGTSNQKVKDISQKMGLIAGPGSDDVVVYRDQENNGTIDWNKVYNDAARNMPEATSTSDVVREDAPSYTPAPAAASASLRGNDLIASLTM